MSDTIEFYYKNKLVGKNKVLEGSDRKTRWRIAHSIGIKNYDRFCIVNTAGRARWDSNSSPKVKSRNGKMVQQYWLFKEINFYKAWSTKQKH